MILSIFCKFKKENPCTAKCWKCEWRIFLLLIYKGKSLYSKMLKMWVENFSFVNLQRKILVQQNAENVSGEFFFCKFPLLTGVYDFAAGLIYHQNLYSIRMKISAFHSRHFCFAKIPLCERLYTGENLGPRF